MGAHSSLSLSEAQAIKLYKEHIGDISGHNLTSLVLFFDDVLDSSLYNLVLTGQHEENTDLGLVESLVKQWVAENPNKVLDTPANENALLRRLLAVRVAGPALYHDDGELQDNSVQPFIDFVHDPARTIQEKLQERGRRQLEARQHG